MAQRRMATSRAKLIVSEAEREAEDIKRNKALEGTFCCASRFWRRLSSSLRVRWFSLCCWLSCSSRCFCLASADCTRLIFWAAVFSASVVMRRASSRPSSALLRLMSSKLIESLKDEAKTAAASYINDIMDDAKMTANKEAKRIVVQMTAQRLAVSRECCSRFWP